MKSRTNKNIIIFVFAFLNFPYLPLGNIGFTIILFTLSLLLRTNYSLKEKTFFKILSIFFSICAIHAIWYHFYLNIDMKFTLRGISISIQRIVELLFCYQVVKKYREKTLEYWFYGLCLAYSINIVYAIYHIGFQQVITALFSIFSSGIISAGSETDKYLEVSNSILLIMPFLSSFYLYKYLHERKKNFLYNFIIAIIISLLAYKRIAITAACIVFILFHLKVLYNKLLINLSGIIMITASLFFLLFIKSGILFLYSSLYNIDLMSRDRIWKSLEDLYDISYQFLGYGWGFTIRYIQENANLSFNIGGVHNDFLKTYIDLGMIGYIIYFGFFFIYLPIYLMKKLDKNTSYLFWLFQIYFFILYFTDNTMTYFACQASMYILVFSNRLEKVNNCKLTYGK